MKNNEESGAWSGVFTLRDIEDHIKIDGTFVGWDMR
jgi:hypothetical protein